MDERFKNFERISADYNWSPGEMAWPDALGHSVIGIVGPNIIRGADVCDCLFCVVLCR
jgi:hypothetical protein